MASNLKRSKRTVGKRLTDIQSRVSTIEKRPAAKALSDAAVATTNLAPGAVGGWMIDADALYIGVKTASGSYAPAGSMTISSDGHISANQFRIDSNGDALFKGKIGGGTIDIGDDDITSFHVNVGGNMWLGAGTFNDATFSVTSGGVLKAASGKIGGYKITNDGTLILERTDVNFPTVELALGSIFLRDADIDNATNIIEMNSGSIVSESDFGDAGNRFVLDGETGGAYFYRTSVGYDPDVSTEVTEDENQVLGEATYFARSTDGILMQLERPYTAGQDFVRFKSFSTDSQVGRISYTGFNSTAFIGTSDARLKENARSISNAIETVKRIEPVNYNFISDPENSFDGFIAQDMYEVYPQVVSVGTENVKENPWGIDYAGMTPLLTAAIKEIIQRLEDLESRN